jgi:hypothetical protein
MTTARTRIAIAVLGIGVAVFAIQPWLTNLEALGLAVLWGLSGLIFAATPLVILAPLAMAPGLARRVGRWVEARASSPSTLLAARRLSVDPRGTGRAGATIGAFAVVVGMVSVVSAGQWPAPSGADSAQWLLVGGVVLVGLAVGGAGVGLLIGVFNRRAQDVQPPADRRRAMAAAITDGVPGSVLRDVRYKESLLATLPVAVIGVLCGSVSWGGVLLDSPDYLLSRDVPWIVGVDLAMILVVWLGAWFSSWSIWPLIRRAPALESFGVVPTFWSRTGRRSSVGAI